MKRFLAKIWVPLTLVIMAGLQSFGIDASRAVGFRRITDSLTTNQLPDTTDVRDSVIPADIPADSTINLILSAKDTIQIPDSLKDTDPFKYKYYIAIKDSTTRHQVRDSLMAAGDSLELAKLDSLYIKDSTETAKAIHDKWLWLFLWSP